MEVDAGGGGDVYQVEGGLCGLLLRRRGRGWWREICCDARTPTAQGRQVPQHRHRVRSNFSGTRGDSRDVHQAVADGVDDQLGGFVNAERVHDIGAMDADGVDAERKLVGDFFVGFAVDDELEDF